MLNKTILFLLLLATTFFSLHPQDPIYFAVGMEGLDPFTSMFQNEHFVPLVAVLKNPHENYKIQITEALRQFPVKKTVVALGESGRLYELTVIEYDPGGDQYTPILKLQNPPNELILAANTPGKLTFLPSRAVKLSKKMLNILQKKAQGIWKKERIKPHNQWELPEPKLTLLAPKILSIEVLPEIVAVVFPVLFSRFESIDDRGSFFFLFDRKTNKILRAHFGHPEWTVPPPDSVLNIVPRLFFRIVEFKTPYLLADLSYSWESRGYAIINMISGDIESLTTY